LTLEKSTKTGQATQTSADKMEKREKKIEVQEEFILWQWKSVVEGRLHDMGVK